MNTSHGQACRVASPCRWLHGRSPPGWAWRAAGVPTGLHVSAWGSGSRSWAPSEPRFMPWHLACCLSPSVSVPVGIFCLPLWAEMRKSPEHASPSHPLHFGLQREGQGKRTSPEGGPQTASPKTHGSLRAWKIYLRDFCYCLFIFFKLSKENHD